jgi:hypothetical protein
MVVFILALDKVKTIKFSYPPPPNTPHTHKNDVFLI